jgi:hypothetical protein
MPGGGRTSMSRSGRRWRGRGPTGPRTFRGPSRPSRRVCRGQRPDVLLLTRTPPTGQLTRRTIADQGTQPCAALGGPLARQESVARPGAVPSLAGAIPPIGMSPSPARFPARLTAARICSSSLGHQWAYVRPSTSPRRPRCRPDRLPSSRHQGLSRGPSDAPEPKANLVRHDALPRSSATEPSGVAALDGLRGCRDCLPSAIRWGPIG